MDPSDPVLLATAGQLLEVFRDSPGSTRAQLCEESKPVAESQNDPLFIRGLEKLLLDRTEFDTSTSGELLSLRHSVFARSSELLSEETINAGEFRRLVAKDFDRSPDDLAARLYSDLPDCQPVLSFRALSPERLLHRYNCAQVQGLLLYSESLLISLVNPEAARMRQLVKYLKFHQLLAQIRQKGPKLMIEVDGPLSLFTQTRKYGLNLAAFFPGLLHQEAWAATAEVRIKGRSPCSLYIDHTSPLRPYSSHFHSYVPEDLAMFHSLFAERVSDWEIRQADEFIRLEGESHSFPDFVLTHASGFKIALELFHAWHEGPLNARIKSLETERTPPLLIGVSSRLAKKPEIARALQNSRYFSRYGFEFYREMPTTGAVEKLLETLL